MFYGMGYPNVENFLLLEKLFTKSETTHKNNGLLTLLLNNGS